MGKGDGGGETTGSQSTGTSGPDARIGSVVDKYTIVRMLGQGGMGAVYEARHATVARRFAIKFLLPEIAAKPEVLRRFENEAKAAGGLEHPNLVAVTDFGRAADGSPYLVMEFLQGEDCAQLLRRVGPLPVSRATDLVLQACRGLVVAHRAGIIHRDLKPENLFLTEAGDGSDLVKVLDFGIAKLQQSDASISTGTGTTFGTAYYMSPEQARGAGDVDQRADVWSLGVVLYELLSGRKPFEGDQFLHVIHQILSVDPPPLASLRSDLPSRLVAVVERAMAKNAAERLQSALAFAQALAPFARQGVPFANARRAQPPSPTAPTPDTRASVNRPLLNEPRAGNDHVRTQPPAPVRRSAARVVVGAAFVIALVGAVLTMRKETDRPPVPPTPSGAQTLPSPPARPTVSEPRQDSVPDPTANRVPAPRPSPAPPTAPPAARPPAGVRSKFEHSEHGSSKRGARRRGAPPTPPLDPASIPNSAPPKALPETQPATGRSIDIEKDNPYNP
jgi:serine/threonine-protein kinase